MSATQRDESQRLGHDLQELHVCLREDGVAKSYSVEVFTTRLPVQLTKPNHSSSKRTRVISESETAPKRGLCRDIVSVLVARERRIPSPEA